MKSKHLIIVLLICLIHTTVSAQLTWNKRSDFGGLARYAAVSFTINGKAYVGLGRSDLELVRDFWEYDTLIKVWSKKADYPGKGRLGAFAFSIGSKGYVGGGNDDNFVHVGDFWEYDPASDKWTQKGKVPFSDRIGAVGFSIGSRGYVGTGQKDGLPTHTYFNDFWEYEPAKNNWIKRANFGGGPRVFATAFSMNGKGYIGLGSDASIEYKDFWEYEPSGDVWTRKKDFPGKGRNQAVGFPVNGKAYIGTGAPGKGDDFDDFWEYDPATGGWKQHVNIIFGSKSYAVGFSIGSKGYVATGKNSLAWYSSDFIEFNPAITIGVDETENEKPVIAYPNPCNGWITVYSAIPVSKITVSTALGQEVIRHSGGFDKREILLDLSDQPNGFYFVHVYSTKGIISTKISVTGR